MSQEATPRRALPDPQMPNRKPLIAGLAGLALVAVVGTGIAVGTGKGNTSSSEPSSAATCAAASTVLVDPAWAQQVKQAADAFGQQNGAGCQPITVETRSSAEVAHDGLGTARGWIPEDPAWLASSTAALKKATPTTLGSSPLVLVNTPEAAAALKTPLTGQALHDMLTTRATWKNHGHAEWGWFKLVLPKVASSVAGPVALNSLVGVAGNGAGLPTDFGTATPAQLDAAKPQQRVVAQPELAQVTSQLATNPADSNGLTPAGPRTGVTTLALALASPTPVKAGWLDDHSGLTMSLVNPAKDATVAKFSSWLAGDDGVKALADAGMSTAKQGPAADRLTGLGLTGSAPKVAANDPRAVAGGQQAMVALSQRDSVLLVVDTSGSMARPLEPGGPSRLDVVTNYVLKIWGAYPAGMANGLITFNASNDAAQKPQVKVVVPLQRDDTPEWVKTAPTYLGSMKNITLEGGTPLYQAIGTAWQHNMEHYQPGMTNRIIVITDGADQDARGAMSYDQLMKILPAKQDPAKPVKVTYAAIGPDADITTLQKIAKATGQQAVQLDSAAELQTRITELMQS